MSVAAVVVWVPGDVDPRPCLASLEPQVDELLMVANPGTPPPVADGIHVLVGERPLGFGANVNRGVAATNAPFVIAANADVEAAEGAVAAWA